MAFCDLLREIQRKINVHGWHFAIYLKDEPWFIPGGGVGMHRLFFKKHAIISQPEVGWRSDLFRWKHMIFWGALRGASSPTRFCGHMARSNQIAPILAIFGVFFKSVPCGCSTLSGGLHPQIGSATSQSLQKYPNHLVTPNESQEKPFLSVVKSLFPPPLMQQIGVVLEDRSGPKCTSSLKN